MDSNQFSRRRVLQIGGAGTISAVAGCNALGQAPVNQEAGETPDDGDGTADSTVTVAAQANEEERMAVQQEFLQKQQEIQQQAEDGEIDQEEAQERLQSAQQEAQAAQQELVDAAIEAIEAYVEDEAALSLEGTEADAGALLVAGEAESLIELLETDEVGALLPGDRFEDAQQSGQ